MRRAREPIGTYSKCCRTSVWLAVAVCLAAGAPPAAAVQPDGPPAFLKFSVQDPDGNFFPKGEMEFCLPDGRCLYADIDQGFPGHFIMPSRKLVAGQTYTVMVYDPDVDVIYETRDWVYTPEDYDPGFDRLLDVEKFLVFPQFRGDEHGGLQFKVTYTLNPEWEARAGLKMAADHPDSIPHYPSVLTTVSVPVMFGSKFRSDPEAAGGVLSVSPGIALDLSWRWDYPRRMYLTGDWIPFREFTVSYAGNRYETAEIVTPGRTSDVTFHRVAVSYGIGRMSPAETNQWSLAAAVGLGVVMDGPETLAFRDRTYRMFGGGLRARYIRELLAGDGMRAGVVVQGDVMYYPADTGDDDFWHGLATSAALGLVIY